MKKAAIVFLLPIFLIVIVMIYNSILHDRSVTALNRLLAGTEQIASLEFSGQQRYTNVASPVIANYFSQALRTESGVPEGGLVYDFNIRTRSGKSIRTHLSYNEFTSSFSIGLLTYSEGDEKYKSCSFPLPIPPEVNQLLKFLADTNLYRHD